MNSVADPLLQRPGLGPIGPVTTDTQGDQGVSRPEKQGYRARLPPRVMRDAAARAHPPRSPAARAHTRGVHGRRRARSCTLPRSAHEGVARSSPLPTQYGLGKVRPRAPHRESKIPSSSACPRPSKPTVSPSLPSHLPDARPRGNTRNRAASGT